VSFRLLFPPALLLVLIRFEYTKLSQSNQMNENGVGAFSGGVAFMVLAESLLPTSAELEKRRRRMIHEFSSGSRIVFRKSFPDQKNGGMEIFFIESEVILEPAPPFCQ
jgi:hypothetical protein